jgi:hypothetical protein
MDPVPKPDPPLYTDAELLLGLANELQTVSHIVDGYGRFIGRNMDKPDALQRASATLVKVGEHLREMPRVLRVIAERLAVESAEQTEQTDP